MTTNWTISKLECKVLENGLANIAYVAYKTKLSVMAWRKSLQIV